MDAKKYLEMSVEELNQNLITDVMTHISEVHDMVREVRLSKRYSESPEFSAFMDSASVLASYTMGDYSLVFECCEDLARRAEELSLWNLVSLHWNLLGGSYLVYGVYEKSMECYYHVIKNEKAHDLKGFLPPVYNNISMLYMHLNENDKARSYLELAIEILKEGGEDQPRYAPKLLMYQSNLLIIFLAMKDREKAKELMREINLPNISQVSMDALYSYYRACIFYHIMFDDIETAHDYFTKARELYGGQETINLGLLSDYITQCQENDVDLQFYEQEILELENFQLCHKEDTNKIIIDCLRRYYALIGNSEKMLEFWKYYISVMEQYVASVHPSRLNSVNLVEELLHKKDEMALENSKHSDLEIIAREAVFRKNESQKAFHRIQMIHQIGQKLTSSTNLESVVDLIYENLRESVTMNSFILMISDKEKRELRSIAYYEGERKLPEIHFSWTDPNSLFAECFRTNQPIVIGNFLKDPRFFYRKILQVGNSSVKSGIFFPLHDAGEVIGAFSVQDGNIDTYGQDDLEFLDLLSPYLSIALKNAMYSRKLEREIHDRMQAQKELEEANQKLKRLSSLDGLTQIANRREFERRILELLHMATEREQPVSIFMFDIDNFKKYNDTYGHLQGDEALKLVAATVREHLEKAGGLSARFGGEEFIGACAGLSEEESRRLGEAICLQVRDLKIENSAVPLGILTLSIGVCVGEGKTLENKSLLMRNADVALYEAKNGGKNRVIVYRVSTT